MSPIFPLPSRIQHNETTRKLDLFINSLSAGSSYLATVTPLNKKGVGKKTHVIVDTLRHPAVELTQAEEGARGGGSGGAGGQDGLGGEGGKRT